MACRNPTSKPSSRECRPPPTPHNRNYRALSALSRRIIDTLYTMIDEEEEPITTPHLLERLGRVSETDCRSSLRVLARRRIIEVEGDMSDPRIVAVAHPNYARLDVRTMNA